MATSVFTSNPKTFLIELAKFHSSWLLYAIDDFQQRIFVPLVAGYCAFRNFFAFLESWIAFVVK